MAQHTLIQRMGFADRELGSPKHDAIMIWLDKVVRDPRFQWFAGHSESWTDRDIHRMRYRYNDAGDKDLEESIARDKQRGERPPKPQFELREVTWEKAITDGRIVGFIDLYVRTSHPVLIARSVDDEWKVEDWEAEFNFEVKPEIKSIGEVIRQVRFYEKHGCRITIVSPPNPQAEAVFEAQRIRFFPCPEPDALLEAQKQPVNETAEHL